MDGAFLAAMFDEDPQPVFIINQDDEDYEKNFLTLFDFPEPLLKIEEAEEIQIVPIVDELPAKADEFGLVQLFHST